MDKVEIVVRGGRGGDGAVSFRREKYVPRGGPDGGNGGKGGDVYLVASNVVDGLEVFKGRRLFEAEAGGRGEGQKKHGRDGRDLIIEVPVGTEISEVGPGDSSIRIGGVVKLGQKVLVARGGAGGLGNACFATPSRQAPEKATSGRPGEERRLVLELKHMVDVAIVSLPNAGRSTLLNRVSAARPRIADYPFTTREVILGAVDIGDDRLVLAELPALVSGAHAGRGLGNQFLRHAERASVLLLLLDGTSPAPWDDLKVLDSELGHWRPSLADRSRLVAVNKVDLDEVKGRVPEVKRRLDGSRVMFISALTGEGVPELMGRLAVMVREARSRATGPEEAVAVFRPRPVDEGGS
ncbi:MAG: GTPase ObgE [Dehalococcoidia bacterium]|nr:GTPase ObgE [Dehalococcoidia bacterium]